MSWWIDSSGTASTQTITLNDSDSVNTITFPDPLIDWLPDSCLYEKYIPAWHLVRSYKH